MEENKSIKTILQKYISERIPQKQTNIFWMMFNGIEAMFTQLEYILKIRKREDNIFTANYLSSLRSLAAKNGFEPTLKIPSSGIIKMTLKPKLFNRVGFPLYLPPYSVFKNKLNNIEYYYNSDKTLKLDNNSIMISLVEGKIVSTNFISTGKYIERFYIESNDISNNSINVTVGSVKYIEVKSFFDNDNVNDNHQFLVKYSNNPQTPIILYIKGTTLNDNILVDYKITYGELGNVDYKADFETQDIIDAYNIEIVPNDDEIEIYNVSGFSFGSNGTDENSLRASIGYNHGQQLLYDAITYRDFINKFSTILLQNVINDTEQKSINNIYISKKQIINDNLGIGIINQYRQCINNKSYLLTKSDIKNLSDILSKYEYCLSSNNLFPAKINKFAIQIMFDTLFDLNNYSNLFQIALYTEFSKFLYDKNHVLNFEIFVTDFMKKHDINFQYTIFNSNVEAEKIKNSKQLDTPYIIKHENELPILCGDFNISGTTFEPIKLFFDVNIISKDSIKTEIL